MAYAQMNTLDTFDMMGVEVELDFALDELREIYGTDPDAGPLVQWICTTVGEVENRVIACPGDVQENIQALNKVREALEKLGIAGQEAHAHLDVYLAMWVQK